MNFKKNKLLLGIIILIIGTVALLGGTPIFKGIGYFVTLFAGLAFLLLYKTKRKLWSLFIGGFLTYIGTVHIITPLIGRRLANNMFGAMFFLVPAIAFFVLYLYKNKRGLIVPAAVMLWFGIFLCIKDTPVFNWFNTSGLFFLCMGASFFMIYIMGRFGKWSVITGITLSMFGFFFR